MFEGASEDEGELGDGAGTGITLNDLTINAFISHELQWTASSIG